MYWDQMEFKHPELIKRQFGATAILMTIALLGTSVISLANYGMGPVMAGAENIAIRIGMQAGFTVMIILGNIFIFIFTPMLANHIERHYTFGGKELSCYCKMFGFQVSSHPVTHHTTQHNSSQLNSAQLSSTQLNSTPHHTTPRHITPSHSTQAQQTTAKPSPAQLSPLQASHVPCPACCIPSHPIPLVRTPPTLP